MPNDALPDGRVAVTPRAAVTLYLTEAGLSEPPAEDTPLPTEEHAEEPAAPGFSTGPDADPTPADPNATEAGPAAVDPAAEE